MLHVYVPHSTKLSKSDRAYMGEIFINNQQDKDIIFNSVCKILMFINLHC